jgi:hypothetical protein
VWSVRSVECEECGWSVRGVEWSVGCEVSVEEWSEVWSVELLKFKLFFLLVNDTRRGEQ